MDKDLGICNAFWNWCSAPADIQIIAKDGGWFGNLCHFHADELERNMISGKKSNEERYLDWKRDSK